MFLGLQRVGDLCVEQDLPEGPTGRGGVGLTDHTPSLVGLSWTVVVMSTVLCRVSSGHQVSSPRWPMAQVLLARSCLSRGRWQAVGRSWAGAGRGAGEWQEAWKRSSKELGCQDVSAESH